MVAGMKKAAPHGTANMQWMAGALGGDSQDFWRYFFTPANHAGGVMPPVDYLSFHFYASCSDRGDPNSYEQFFSEADGMTSDILATIAVRDAMAPLVKIDMDEMGVILPDDNDGKWTSSDPGFPNVFWNAAAGLFAYEFSKWALIGVEVLGMSQLVGYPYMSNYPGGPAGYLDPQFPSVAILNWTDGSGTARYWVLKMLIEEFHLGDALQNTSTSVPPTPDADPFCGSILNLQTLQLQCTDPTATIEKIVYASYGTNEGSCPNWTKGACDAPNSTTIVEGYCLGKNSCSVPATTDEFGDPCFGTVKYLDVVAHCSTGGGFQPNAGGAAPVHAQAFKTGDGKRKVLITNTQFAAHSANVAGATGGTMQTVDEATGFGPPRVEAVASDDISLAPYAVVLVTMP